MSEFTESNTTERFKKMAFKIESPEQSKQLQEILFEQGYSWTNGGKRVNNTHENWLGTSHWRFGDIIWSDELEDFYPNAAIMDTQKYIDDYYKEKFPNLIINGSVKSSFYTRKNGEYEILEEPVQKSQLEISDGSTANYYQVPEGVKELQDIISYLNLNAQLGEIIRAVYRSGKVGHSSRLRDAKKIKFYAEAEIKRLEMYGEE